MDAPNSLSDDTTYLPSLIEMERELTRLLIEYDELETAWPKCRHVLIRSRAGPLGRRHGGQGRRQGNAITWHYLRDIPD